MKDELNAMDNPFRLYSRFLADAVSCVGILLTKPLCLVGYCFQQGCVQGIVYWSIREYTIGHECTRWSMQKYTEIYHHDSKCVAGLSNAHGTMVIQF